MPEPTRQGTNIQFRWITRWVWGIIPTKALQFRERIIWRSHEDGMFRDHERWTKWREIFWENEDD